MAVPLGSSFDDSVPRIFGNAQEQNHRSSSALPHVVEDDACPPTTPHKSRETATQKYPAAIFDFSAVLNNAPAVAENDMGNGTLLQQTLILSFFANICLLGTKIFIAVVSRSMTIIACAIDSLMDVLSGFLILLTQRVILQKQQLQFDKKYPAGRSLLEPVCTIVYTTIMASVSVQLCFFSIQGFFQPVAVPTNVDISTLLVLFFTVLVKLILLAFCALSSKSRGDYLYVLTSDHKADVFANSIAFMTVLLLYFFDHLRYLDNVAALLITAFASITWIYSNKDLIRVLSGYKADQTFYKYIATIIDQFQGILVDDIKAYYFGVKYMVELDIVMDSATTIGEYVEIQKKLKAAIMDLPMVQQCFININHQILSGDEALANSMIEPRISRRRGREIVQ